MPSIYKDIDVDEFIDECNGWEIEKIISKLRRDGYLEFKEKSCDKDNLMDCEYKSALDKLYSKRLYLTLKEEEYIKQLASKL